MEIRKITCIGCPMGCQGEVHLDGQTVTKLQGFNCPRGQEYARQEVLAPKRTLTTTVRVRGGKLTLLPVVSAKQLPKQQIIHCAQFLRGITVDAPIREGQVICADILGLGVDMIASRPMDCKEETGK